MKYNVDGSIEKFKAHLIAKGFIQSMESTIRRHASNPNNITRIFLLPWAANFDGKIH